MCDITSGPSQSRPRSRIAEATPAPSLPRLLHLSLRAWMMSWFQSEHSDGYRSHQHSLLIDS